MEEWKNSFKLAQMRLWLDSYPTRVNVMYGYKNLVTTHTIICTNLEPHEIFPKCSPTGREAFFRRVLLYRITRTGNTTWMMRTDSNGADEWESPKDSNVGNDS